MRFIHLASVLLLTAGCSDASSSNGAHASSAAPLTQALAPLRWGWHPQAHGSSPALREALSGGAERLADLQADILGDNAANGFDDSDPDDGGWDWQLPADAESHSSEPSADNAFGATGLGPWAAIRAGLDLPRARNLLTDLALGAQQGATIDSPLDFLFLTLLAEQTQNPGFSELARRRYDAVLAAGGGAEAIAEKNRDQRHADGQDGVIPFDLAWRSLGAGALDDVFPDAGYAADAATFQRVLADDLESDPPLFDIHDSQEAFYATGLAWSLVSLQPNTASYRAVLARLLDAQNADGAWGWNAEHPESHVQSTAHALSALTLNARADWDARYAARRAAAWLLQAQAPNGGWPSPTGQEIPQVDGEAMLALYLWQLGFGAGEALEPSAPEASGAAYGKFIDVTPPPMAAAPLR